MNEIEGRVFSVVTENQPIADCTVSKRVTDRIYHFSLAAGTDISPEAYPVHKLWIIWDGAMNMLPAGQLLKEGAACITPIGCPIGCSTEKGCIYTEISLRRNTNVNQNIKAGEVFRLSELVPYQEGRIVNMDVVNESKMKLVIMSFDRDTGLPEHSAPGDALVCALEGSGIIGYEGKEHPIKAGENFRFAKGGLHSVKATERFKMALLLVLE